MIDLRIYGSSPERRNDGANIVHPARYSKKSGEAPDLPDAKFRALKFVRNMVLEKIGLYYL